MSPTTDEEEEAVSAADKETEADAAADGETEAAFHRK